RCRDPRSEPAQRADHRSHGRRPRHRRGPHHDLRRDRDAAPVRRPLRIPFRRPLDWKRPMISLSRTTLRAGAALCLLLALSACGSTRRRLAEIGQEPKLTRVVDPTAVPGYQPIVMPMPAPMPMERQANSLWRNGGRAFLKDQRASTVGDILTVLIRIDDKAQIQNRTTRTRNNSESAGLPSFLGLESKLGKILPSAVDPASLIDMQSGTANEGSGAVNRGEAINLKIAALVTQVLPNGNTAIQGRQE